MKKLTIIIIMLLTSVSGFAMEQSDSAWTIDGFPPFYHKLKYENLPALTNEIRVKVIDKLNEGHMAALREYVNVDSADDPHFDASFEEIRDDAIVKLAEMEKEYLEKMKSFIEFLNRKPVIGKCTRIYTRVQNQANLIEEKDGFYLLSQCRHTFL